MMPAWAGLSTVARCGEDGVVARFVHRHDALGIELGSDAGRRGRGHRRVANGEIEAQEREAVEIRLHNADKSVRLLFQAFDEGNEP